MGEVLTQVWLKSIKKSVSYLTNKRMHKKRKASRVHASSHKLTKKCAMKMKESRSIRKKRCACKNVLMGEFIRRLWKGHVMDSHGYQQASGERFLIH